MTINTIYPRSMSVLYSTIWNSSTIFYIVEFFLAMICSNSTNIIFNKTKYISNDNNVLTSWTLLPKLLTIFHNSLFPNAQSLFLAAWALVRRRLLGLLLVDTSILNQRYHISENQRIKSTNEIQKKNQLTYFNIWNKPPQQLCYPIWITIMSFIHDQTVSSAIFLFQKKAGSATLQLSTRHDGYTVAEKISLVHEMGGQQHSAAVFLGLKEIPKSSSRRWIHTSRWFVQHHDFWVTTQRYTDAELAFHSTR